MSEEMYIKEKMGTRNPFTVPDGYFDSLADQIIGKLPKAESDTRDTLRAEETGSSGRHPAIVRYLRPLLYAAACAVLAVAVGAIWHNAATSDSQQLVAHQQESVATYSDTYMEDMADYAMIDNEEIYASMLADM